MIGALRHKITVLTPSRIADSGGGAGLIWSPGASLWARVIRLSTIQDFVGDRRRRLKRIAATIRLRDDIEPGMRVLYESDLYEITSVESGDDRERRLTLICEGVAL